MTALVSRKGSRLPWRPRGRCPWDITLHPVTLARGRHRAHFGLRGKGVADLALAARSPGQRSKITCETKITTVMLSDGTHGTALNMQGNYAASSFAFKTDNATVALITYT